GDEAQEEQMRALGAKLVAPNTSSRTLGEAQMEEASEASVLMSCARNVSAGYTRCLKWCAELAGAPLSDDIGYELNTDFEISRMTTAARQQLLQEWQANAISFTEYRAILRRAGIATEEDADALEEIERSTLNDVIGSDFGGRV